MYRNYFNMSFFILTSKSDIDARVCLCYRFVYMLISITGSAFVVYVCIVYVCIKLLFEVLHKRFCKNIVLMLTKHVDLLQM